MQAVKFISRVCFVGVGDPFRQWNNLQYTIS